MKTPDEIKKGLEHCSTKKPCTSCPMWEECKKASSLKPLWDNALAYIQQLEAANTELLTKVEQLTAKCHQLERERDALLKDIGSAQGCICIICKNYNNPDPGTGTAECNILGRFKDCGSDGALMCGQFKWHGVKEE